ncbi:putative hydrolase NDAI_0G06120 [Naumovozyma dairenensis CBS 421]|uniref:CN hydrolase domain-containing protein n=1 Tax=Naumovozyma dairenensis (strain ATCC 10597 / BCRC 20456 / CBS 421 / NBRC 0211 / NRRL Y-12639) TaxID=1071378 RepID=J7SBV1_NAUDC|nr:hypothetical protein NDAI_0G06120 [Naumovozyma dairenensis CBS 421]CCK73595.1 hypothetical protein NDAI_0G06120 [Naumovozyma dairenensis CBS 421]
MSKIAIGQLCSSSNISRNLITVKNLILKAIDNDVKLIFFPEATDFISQNASHSKLLAQQTPKFIKSLQSFIKDSTQDIEVSIGVHLPPTSEDDRVKNTLLYINSNGNIISTYQKLHLFDVDVPNGPILKESESVQPGVELPNIIDTPVGKLGTAICYDIRFPELSLNLRSRGAEILCFPSAFTMKTGEAHWKLLGRSRAIDTQCYVIMPAQCGVHDVSDDEWSSLNGLSENVKRESWGHSMIVDPWGEVIVEASENDSDPQLIISELDMEKLKQVRGNMPLWDQRRADINFHSNLDVKEM